LVLVEWEIVSVVEDLVAAALCFLISHLQVVELEQDI
jgi:hypothetical protein